MDDEISTVAYKCGNRFSHLARATAINRNFKTYVIYIFGAAGRGKTLLANSIVYNHLLNAWPYAEDQTLKIPESLISDVVRQRFLSDSASFQDKSFAKAQLSRVAKSRSRQTTLEEGFQTRSAQSNTIKLDASSFSTLCYQRNSDDEWYDGYCGQYYFKLDDFNAGRGQELYPLLQIMDNQPAFVRQRNKMEYSFTSKVMLITSNFSYDELLASKGYSPDEIEAFSRRINHRYELPDYLPMNSSSEQFKEIQKQYLGMIVRNFEGWARIRGNAYPPIPTYKTDDLLSNLNTSRFHVLRGYSKILP